MKPYSHIYIGNNGNNNIYGNNGNNGNNNIVMFTIVTMFTSVIRV